MTWLEIAAIVVLFLGIAAGGFLVSQRPTFWAGLFAVLIQTVYPYIARYVSARMTPEQEKEMHDCVRRGGEWDSFRKRCKTK